MYNFLWQRLKNQPRTFKDWIYPLGNKIITRGGKKKLARQGQQSLADKE